MPSLSEKSFRTAVVGGFNRQDVLEYISASARERHNEIDAYRAGADKLRGERDALGDALSKQVAEVLSLRERADRLEIEVSELRREMESLSAENARLSQRERELTMEISVLSPKLLAFENGEKEFGEARLRTEELEMRAYRRAEEIESEAAVYAEKLRFGAREMLSELSGKLEEIRSDSEKATYQIVLELDRMRSWCVHCGDAFQEAVERLNELGPADYPIVREFVPREFS